MAEVLNLRGDTHGRINLSIQGGKAFCRLFFANGNAVSHQDGSVGTVNPDHSITWECGPQAAVYDVGPMGVLTVDSLRKFVAASR